ncbi:CapA family protein [Haloechinothrix alba]|nr:CapA family protein [Haloechinothrix alba]
MKQFTVVFTGDTSLGDWYVQRAEPDIQRRLREQPLSFFDEVEPLVTDKDLFITNFESVLADNPTSPLQGQKNYLGWDSPERSVDALKRIGVDAVSLANNHTMDFGREILADTAAKLTDVGIHTFGAGKGTSKAAEPLVRRIRIGDHEKNLYVLGALKNSAVMREQYRFFATETEWGLHPLATRAVAHQIAELRADDPDALIILYPHWGQNYQWASDLMWRTSERFRKAGADLIIGHGAHMLQELNVSQHGSTVFSLGNFVFNSRGRYTSLNAPPYSLVSRLSLGVSAGRWQAALRLYPIVTDNVDTTYRSRPVTRDEAHAVFHTLAARSAEPSAFGRSYSLEKDGRGWHILQTRPISARYDSAARPSRRGQWRGKRLLATPRDHYPDAGADQATQGDAATGTSASTAASAQFPPGSERYGPGSTHECLAKALAARGVPYSAGKATIRDRSRPALRFTINDIPYVSSAAIIYHARDDGSTRTVNHRAARVAKRKDLLAHILDARSFAVPRGSTFGSARKRDALLYFDALSTTFRHGFCVKPVDGSLGRDVHTGITTRAAFEHAFDAVAAAHDEVLVQEELPGEVYRFLYVGGHVAAIRTGLPMNVRGDGERTIAQLVADKNNTRRENPIHQYYPLEIGRPQREELDRQGRTPESIPAAGETVYLAQTSNLHRGADMVDRTDDVHPSYKDEVARAVSSIPGMHICGADVIIQDHHAPAEPGNHGIIELNTGPGVGGHHYPWSGQPRDAAGDIVDYLLTLKPADLGR